MAHNLPRPRAVRNRAGGPESGRAPVRSSHVRKEMAWSGACRRPSRMSDFGQDLRYAFRGLLKNGGFTTIALLTIGIGIGANATGFGWMRALLLHPPPGAAEPPRGVAGAGGAPHRAPPPPP